MASTQYGSTPRRICATWFAASPATMQHMVVTRPPRCPQRPRKGGNSAGQLANGCCRTRRAVPPFCIVPVKLELRPVAAHNRHSCAGYDARARGSTDAVLLVIGRIRLQSGRVIASGADEEKAWFADWAN